jgi:hypothetical protein
MIVPDPIERMFRAFPSPHLGTASLVLAGVLVVGDRLLHDEWLKTLVFSGYALLAWRVAWEASWRLRELRAPALATGSVLVAAWVATFTALGPRVIAYPWALQVVDLLVFLLSMLYLTVALGKPLWLVSLLSPL